MTIEDEDGAAGGPKVSRRAACALGAGLSAATLLSLRGGSAAAAPAPAHDLRYVLTDARYEPSLAYGAAWPRVMAELAANRADNGRITAERRFPAGAVGHTASSLSLVSWVIA